LSGPGAASRAGAVAERLRERREGPHPSMSIGNLGRFPTALPYAFGRHDAEAIGSVLHEARCDPRSACVASRERSLA
jgi:hypothetical protein